MGGSACVPTALAAALWGRRWCSSMSTPCPAPPIVMVGGSPGAAAVAFDGTALARAVVTGAPVRAAIVGAAHPGAAAARRPGRARAAPRPHGGAALWRVARVHSAQRGRHRPGRAVGAPDRRVDLPRGGAARDGPWATMRRHAGRPGPGRDGLVYVQVPYEDRMALFYQAADIVVSRAGANTVAELAVVGVPAILVPLPGAPGDHQRANAMVLERAGGAVILPDAECRAPRLAQEHRRVGVANRAGWTQCGPPPARWGVPTPSLPWRPWPGPTPAPRSADPDGLCALTPGRAAAIADRGRPRPLPAPSGARGGSRRGGHERHRLGARRHGPLRHGQRPQVLARPRAPGRQWGGGLRGPRRRPCGRGRDRGPVHRHPRLEPRGHRGPSPGAHGAEPGRGPGRHRRPAALHRGVGDPRQDDDHVHAGPDPDRSRPAPELPHRR